MTDALVELRGFNTLHEAQLAASALRASDIDCEVRNAYVGGAHPELFAGPVIVSLLVRAEDFEAARAVLDTDASVSLQSDEESEGATCAGCGEPLDDPRAACPTCNSESHETVLAPQRTKLAIVKLKFWIVVIFLAIIIAPQIWERLWPRFTDIPDRFVVPAVWTLVTLVAGGLVLRAIRSSETRL